MLVPRYTDCIIDKILRILNEHEEKGYRFNLSEIKFSEKELKQLHKEVYHHLEYIAQSDFYSSHLLSEEGFVRAIKDGTRFTLFGIKIGYREC